MEPVTHHNCFFSLSHSFSFSRIISDGLKYSLATGNWGDQKKAQVHRVLLGRGEGMDPESLDWVKLGPDLWGEEDTAQLPTDLINEIQQFLFDEKAAMLAAGKPPTTTPAKRRRATANSSAEASTATA